MVLRRPNKTLTEASWNPDEWQEKCLIEIKMNAHVTRRLIIHADIRSGWHFMRQIWSMNSFVFVLWPLDRPIPDIWLVKHDIDHLSYRRYSTLKIQSSIHRSWCNQGFRGPVRLYNVYSKTCRFLLSYSLLVKPHHIYIYMNKYIGVFRMFVIGTLLMVQWG